MWLQNTPFSLNPAEMTHRHSKGFDPSDCCINTYNTYIQYNTIQYNTIQYNTIQYNTIQYNTIQYNTIQYNTIQYNTIQYNTYLHTYIHCFWILYSHVTAYPTVSSNDLLWQRQVETNTHGQAAAAANALLMAGALMSFGCPHPLTSMHFFWSWKNRHVFYLKASEISFVDGG